MVWRGFGNEEARRKGANPRWLELFFFPKENCKKGKKEEGFPLYRKWGWVPPLKKLVGLKTRVFEPRRSSTKKKEMFIEIYSFQKIYILRVSEILKIVSRFCVKRLFCPYMRKVGFRGLERKRSKHKSCRECQNQSNGA